MANKGVCEKIQDIFENLTVLQKQLDKIVEILLEKEFEGKHNEKLSSLEENQRLLDEKLCLKIDDMIEISENTEKPEKEINFFAPLP